MAIPHDVFMKFWHNALRAQLAENTVPYTMLGEATYLMLAEDTRCDTIDMKPMLIEDHKHLEGVLDKFSAVNHHTIRFGSSAYETLPEDKREAFLKGASTVAEDGTFVFAEFMEGREVNPGAIKSTREEHAAVLDAFSWTAEQRGISTLLRNDGELTSITPDGEGGHSVNTVLGRKAIDQQVATFADEIDEIFGMGGGDKS